MIMINTVMNAANWEMITLANGIAYLFAAIPIIFAGYSSAILQARVSVAAMGIVAKRPEETTKGMIYAGLVETYAVLTLLISFLLVINVKIG